ncbi:MAG: flagellar hook-basal body complex protein FliE [Variibacter sp.]|jgi:flagellar hook-basal body complex protein FliE|nr:flagellar hook-basal body complex protein FliE [Variibacter sp.]
MPSPTIAANAYAALAKITQSTSPASPVGGAKGGESNFGSLLKDALGGVIDAGRKSDAQSQALVAGKANVVDVVTAVAETEVAVQALVSVRDKVIAAYEEIMRMPI